MTGMTATETESSAVEVEDTETEQLEPEYTINKNASKKVEDLLKKDAEDESLKRYKESLLGAAVKGDLGNTQDPRKVVMLEFRTVFEDPNLTDYIYDAFEKEQTPPPPIHFEIKEGSNYRIKLFFRVQHEIVSGLRFKLKVKRAVFNKVEKVVMGSYGPRSEAQEFEFPRNDWLEAPSGMVSRGEYKGTILLEDIDDVKHSEIHFTFKIVK